MPTLPLHPAVVHLPLGLAFAVPLVAAGLALAWRRRRLPRGAFAVLVGLQALLVASGALSMKLGERDERVARAVVSERLVEAHEERAEAFVWAGAVVLAGAVALLAVPAAAVGAASAAVVAGTIAVAALAVRTGQAGGELVYAHGAAAAWSAHPPAGAPPPRALARDGDDD